MESYIFSLIKFISNKTGREISFIKKEYKYGKNLLQENENNNTKNHYRITRFLLIKGPVHKEQKGVGICHLPTP